MSRFPHHRQTHTFQVTGCTANPPVYCENLHTARRERKKKTNDKSTNQHHYFNNQITLSFVVGFVSIARLAFIIIAIARSSFFEKELVIRCRQPLV